MLNYINEFAISVVQSAAAIAIIGLPCLGALIVLQQIGKHTRTTRDKIGQTRENFRRRVLKRVADRAIDNDHDKVAEVVLDSIGKSYLNSFCRDVRRGITVVRRNCYQKKEDSRFYKLN